MVAAGSRSLSSVIAATVAFFTAITAAAALIIAVLTWRDQQMMIASQLAVNGLQAEAFAKRYASRVHVQMATADCDSGFEVKLCEKVTIENRSPSPLDDPSVAIYTTLGIRKFLMPHIPPCSEAWFPIDESKVFPSDVLAFYFTDLVGHWVRTTQAQLELVPLGLMPHMPSFDSTNKVISSTGTSIGTGQLSDCGEAI